jgi:very-short-patch-repair endonuclease
VPSRNPERLKFARQLRQADVPPEKRLWYALRGAKLGYKFRRQHPIGPYFADFACHERKLIIELDGESHVGERPESNDETRTKYLEENGWRVVRFWNSDVYEDVASVVDAIDSICQGQCNPPSP